MAYYRLGGNIAEKILELNQILNSIPTQQEEAQRKWINLTKIFPYRSPQEIYNEVPGARDIFLTATGQMRRGEPTKIVPREMAVQTGVKTTGQPLEFTGLPATPSAPLIASALSGAVAGEVPNSPLGQALNLSSPTSSLTPSLNVTGLPSGPVTTGTYQRQAVVPTNKYEETAPPVYAYPKSAPTVAEALGGNVPAGLEPIANVPVAGTGANLISPMVSYLARLQAAAQSDLAVSEKAKQGAIQSAIQTGFIPTLNTMDGKIQMNGIMNALSQAGYGKGPGKAKPTPEALLSVLSGYYKYNWNTDPEFYKQMRKEAEKWIERMKF